MNNLSKKNTSSSIYSDIVLTVDSKNWKGKGSFNAEVLDFDNFDNWIKMASGKFKMVVARYEEMQRSGDTSDYLERTLMLHDLNRFLNCLIALRFHVLDKYSNFGVENKEYGFAFSIKNIEDRWEGEGSFTKKYRFKIEKIGRWYEKFLSTKMETLRTLYNSIYGESSKTEEGSKEKLYELWKTIDLLIFHILIVRHNIAN
ncbi:MAG: hypothetical protein GY754_40765 [bacterium]|nr:hypothetical protein [bacterium]